MNVMDAYARSLSDEALLELGSKNLVEPQMRAVRAELERRGL